LKQIGKNGSLPQNAILDGPIYLSCKPINFILYYTCNEFK